MDLVLKSSGYSSALAYCLWVFVCVILVIASLFWLTFWLTQTLELKKKKEMFVASGVKSEWVNVPASFQTSESPVSEPHSGKQYESECVEPRERFQINFH